MSKNNRKPLLVRLVLVGEGEHPRLVVDTKESQVASASGNEGKEKKSCSYKKKRLEVKWQAPQPSLPVKLSFEVPVGSYSKKGGQVGPIEKGERDEVKERLYCAR